MDIVRVAVLGCGYWGPNLARNFARAPGARLVAVADIIRERAEKVGQEYRVGLVTDDPDRVLSHPSIDLVVIATPVWTHYDLARKALESGKHVLVMKPLTVSTEQAEELCDLAARMGLLLAVDHTFIFTGAVQKMKELVDSRELGELYYFDSVRINLGLFQHDVNVLWDLAPHDLSIMDYLVDRLPDEVTAVGMSHGDSPTENIRVSDRALRGFLPGTRARQLACAGEGPAHDRGREPEDAGVRRHGAEREGSGVRQGGILPG